MKHYLGENQNNCLIILDEITTEDHYAWMESVEQLKYYTLAKHFRDIAISNGIEIKKYLKYIARISDMDSLRNANTSAIGIESNRLILNYLVSFRTYVDNLKTYSKNIKRGNDFIKNILNHIYDTEPIYPFLYKLRNFATHYSMVFDSISCNNKLSLQCSKQHLLDYDGWNEKSRMFIESCEEFLPIIDYIEHLNILMMRIYLGFLNYFADDLQEMHNKLIALMKKHHVINPLFIECESIDTLESAKITGLALSVLKDATNELSQLPNINIDYIGPEQVLK